MGDCLLKQLKFTDLNRYLVYNEMEHCLKQRKAEKISIIKVHIESTSNNVKVGEMEIQAFLSRKGVMIFFLRDANMSNDEQSTDGLEDNAENILSKT